MIKRFIYLVPILAMLAFGTSTAWAQTTDASSAADTQVEALASQAQEAEPTYDGITVEEPQQAPSGFGLLWRGLRERVSLALTFNPIKKAEKAMKFAEERMLIAEKVLDKSTDDQAKEQAKKMLERADQLMERVKSSQQDALQTGEESQTTRLLKNRATQFERQQKILDRIEQKTGEEGDDVLELREKFAERGKELEQAINNEQVPEEVRAHLKDVKEKIEAHAQEVQTHVEQARELMQQIQQGSEDAAAKLEALRQERRDQLDKQMEEGKKFKERFEKSFEKKLDDLKSKAEGGDEKASLMIQKIQERPELQGMFEDRMGAFAPPVEGEEGAPTIRQENDGEVGIPADTDRRKEMMKGRAQRVEKERTQQKEQPEQEPGDDQTEPSREPMMAKPEGVFDQMKNFFKKDKEERNEGPREQGEFKGNAGPQGAPGGFKGPQP
ncbi:hypothetical protein HZA85_00935 [Candidatus Uhrbacteria bacterium]|nr:hypothetical protein [Candidatus Uhrbacteria bacterium]